MGRPSEYSPELAAVICARIAEGRSVKSICEDEDMPTRTSVYRWLFQHAEFSDKYARAKQDSAEVIADEIIDIADEASNDWMETYDNDNVGYRLNGEHIQRSRLRIDTRKWLLAKLQPKKYGDKVIHAGDPDNPIEARISPTDDLAAALSRGAVGHTAGRVIAEVAGGRDGAGGSTGDAATGEAGPLLPDDGVPEPP